jgi:hypothetical protein
MRYNRSVHGGLGEAVGINYIALAGRADTGNTSGTMQRAALTRGWAQPGDRRRVAGHAGGHHRLPRLEVDFAVDLEPANEEVSRTVTSAA